MKKLTFLFSLVMTNISFAAVISNQAAVSFSDSAQHSYSAQSNIVNLTVGGTTSNQAPVANAGVDKTTTLGTNVTLSGSATDDGLPNPPATITRTWSKVSGPGTVTFGNANSASTTATFSSAGTYVLRLTASDSLLSDTDDVTITVNSVVPSNRAPAVNAGSDQMVSLPASLVGQVSDDGLPNPPALTTVIWSKVSGPGTVTFANPNAPQTTASFSADGTYVLRLTASDSVLTAFDETTIMFHPGMGNSAPVVNAGTDKTITLPAMANLSGAANDDGMPNPPASLTITWSKMSGPGTVTFGNSHNLMTTASFSQAGMYTLRLSVSDGELTTTDDVQINAQAAPVNTAPMIDAGPDLTIVLPAMAQLSGFADDDGLPNPSHLTITWSKLMGPGVVTINDAAALATHAMFTAPGRYTLRLTVSDGKLAATDDLFINVIQGTKGGESELERRISISPNPSRADRNLDGKVLISGMKPDEKIKIYSSHGMLISDELRADSGGTASLNVLNLPSGNYVVITESGELKPTKFVLIR